MRFIIVILSTLLFINSANGQTKDEILAEAYLLYHSEKASWIGTDIFLDRFSEKQNDIGGYFSYTEDSLHSCIFFDTANDPNLLARITFENDFNKENIKIDTTARKLEVIEKELYVIRQKAISELQQDTLFQKYRNTSLNLIPVIRNGEKKVFVLTASNISGVVLFGNDYLLTFDEENNLVDKKVLHKNLIPIEVDSEDEEVVTMHTHLESTGSLITSTDLCTLMLYEQYTGWEQHYVISKEHVSIWDCGKDELLVMTREAWEKIEKHAENKQQTKN